MAFFYFNAFLILALSFDIFFLSRRKIITFRLAFFETVFWFFLAIIFGLFFVKNSQEYFTAYFLEKSLSIDNLFVLWAIFEKRKTPAHLQHKLLFWGVLGALFFRGLLILLGIQLFEKFPFLHQVMGAFLLYSGYALMRKSSEDSMQPKGFFQGKSFFSTLLAIEFSDLLFALDSIPAVLSITSDYYIVYTSNAFAILGLRSLYSFLQFFSKKNHFLSYSIGMILIFVGLKLFLSSYLVIPLKITWIFMAIVLLLPLFWKSFIQKL